MILITGGAFQGKTAYAQTHFPYPVTDGAICDFDEAKSSKILKNYHELVQRLMACGEDALAFTNDLCAANPGCIVLIDEIGCGVIPADKAERIRRETVGRAGCILAQNAETVIRLVCGIPMALKGTLL